MQERKNTEVGAVNSAGNGKRNYHREMERVIADNEKAGRTPTLFLHACCAPCSSYVLELLAAHFHITLFYYNPNIYPPEEYGERIREVERLIRQLPVKYPVSLVKGDYVPELFYQAVKGYETVPEGRERCEICFKLRLREAARLASEGGFDYFTTTLSISRFKNSVLLNQIGEQMGKEYDVTYLNSDFKKKRGFERSVELSEQYELYRQEYCGCVFSKREREKRIGGDCKNTQINCD